MGHIVVVVIVIQGIVVVVVVHREGQVEAVEMDWRGGCRW